MTFKELTIIDGALPIVNKAAGHPAWVFNPTGASEEVRTDKESFFVPYYKVKRSDVAAWLTKMAANPPNPLGSYESVLLTYSDGISGEPRYGGGFYRVSSSDN